MICSMVASFPSKTSGCEKQKLVLNVIKTLKISIGKVFKYEYFIYRYIYNIWIWIMMTLI